MKATLYEFVERRLAYSPPVMGRRIEWSHTEAPRDVASRRR